MKQNLPKTLKDLAVEVNVPVRELVKLFSRKGFAFPNKPSVKLDPEHIRLVLPSIEEYLSKPIPVSRKTQKRIDKKQNNKRGKKGQGKKKSNKKVEKEIFSSLVAFSSKAPKSPKKKSKFKPKKPVIISTPMKG